MPALESSSSFLRARRSSSSDSRRDASARFFSSSDSSCAERSVVSRLVRSSSAMRDSRVCGGVEEVCVEGGGMVNEFERARSAFVAAAEAALERRRMGWSRADERR